MLRILEARGRLSRLAIAAALVFFGAEWTGVSAQGAQSPGFEGYYIANPTSTEAIICDGTDEFITSGTFANCCATGQTKPCGIPTACAVGTLSYNDASTFVCGTDYSCVTMTIYASSPFATPSARNLFCGHNWVANTIYRNVVTTTSSSSSSSSTSTTPAPTATSPPTSAPTSATTTAGAEGSTSSSSSSGSNAWIAGAVIGPLVAVVGVGLLAFWLGRRHSRKVAASQAGVGGGGYNAGGGAQYSAVPMGQIPPHHTGSPVQHFDPATGQPYDPVKYGSPGHEYAAGAGLYPQQQQQAAWDPQRGSWVAPGQQGPVYMQQQPPPPQPQLPPSELHGSGPGDVELSASPRPR